MPMSTSLSSSSEVVSHPFIWNMFLCHLTLSKLLLVFICCCSVAQSCLTLCNPMDYSISDFPVLHHLLEFAQTHGSWVGDAIQTSHPLSPPLVLPSILPSIRVFSNELTLYIRWQKYWHFSFSISPSNKYSGLIYFRIDWFDLLAVQGTLKTLLQYHSSKASFFMYVVVSHISLPWRSGLL